jgi:hypothetical protein
MATERAIRGLLGWAALLLLTGCGERERLTFPAEDPGDGEGPFTEFIRPEVDDTVVSDGDLLLIQGRTIDPDGVATVYFEVGGARESFAPLKGEGADTVNFSLQISTLNLSGATVVVQAYGVDLLGDQGGPDSRLIRIR